MSTKNARYGLRLTLPGAPDVPHTVHGITGLYYPGRITPVGGVGEPTVEEAEAVAKGPEAPVELVQIRSNSHLAPEVPPGFSVDDGGEDTTTDDSAKGGEE